jgi:general secretion pathway protein F
MRSTIRLIVFSLVVSLIVVAAAAQVVLHHWPASVGREYIVLWGGVAACALSVAGKRLLGASDQRPSALVAAILAMLFFFAMSLQFAFDEAMTALVAFLITGVTVGACYLLWRVGTAFIRQREIQLRVIGQIASIVHQNLPLPAGLALAAQSERGWVRIHLKRISGLLTSGMSLSEAIQRGYPDCPSMAKSLIMAGERTGQLAAAVEEAERYAAEAASRRRGPDLPFWPYATTMVAGIGFIGTMFMVAILPKSIEIFKDYGIPLPSSLRAMRAVARWWETYGIYTTPLFLLIPCGLYLLIRPRRFPELTRASRVGDWIRWRVPALRRLEWAGGLAAVFRTMRLAVRSGLGLDTAARLASEIDVNRELRVRVSRFADLIDMGVNSREAAEQTGLGRVAGMALAAGQQSGDLNAALRYAAEYHEAIIGRWWIVISSMVWPVGTLVMASLVGYFVFAVFQPWSVMMDGVIRSMGVLQ